MSDYAANWVCPYCGHGQVLTEKTHRSAWQRIWNDRSKYGVIGFFLDTKICVNPKCNNLCVDFFLTGAKQRDGSSVAGDCIQAFSLMPESSAKPLPPYIPEPIAENYRQACRIRDLSPNASATLARRCLQGMIRNFCGFEKPTLFKEIEELKKQVDGGNAPQGVAADVVDHIHAVREKGNIGAHMKGDIDLMVDVEPDEAQILIELLELLFDEWYVARAKREERLERAKGLLAIAKPAQALPAAGQNAIEMIGATKSEHDGATC